MATITSNGTGGGLWHDTATWAGGVVPVYGDKVVIEDGDIVELNGDCECGTGIYPADRAAYNSSDWSLQLKGTLKASHTVDSSLNVDGLINYNRSSGSGHSTIDFEDIPENINFVWNLNPKGSMNARGYYFACCLFGSNSDRAPIVKISSAYHRKRNTYIIGEVSAGETIFTVNNSEGWKTGDILFLAPKFTATNQYNSNHEYEEVVIDSISGNDITITSGLLYDHGYADEEDYPAAAVSNKTSNVKVMGYNDATYCPSIYILRGDIKIKDVVGDYLNNGYSLNTDIFRFSYIGLYDTLEHTIESCFFQADGHNLSYHLYGILYTNSVYDTYGMPEVRDIAINHIPPNNRYSYYGIDQFYAGRKIKIIDCNAYCSNQFNNSAQFSDYQQPATYINCKSFNSIYGFSLHDNAITEAINCWSIGSCYSTQCYNGTAKFIDHHFRFVKYLGYPYPGWISFAEYERADFKSIHIEQTDPKNYLYVGNNPDGCIWHFLDIQKNTSNQRWFYSYGQKWWDFSEIRNNPYSIGLKSESNEFSVPHERSFDSSAGDTILVGLYVKNLTPTYIGSLTMSLIQGADIIESQVYDLTSLTTGEWTLLSIGGTAVKDMTTTFKIEYKGDGGEIAITDFIQPFTTDQKQQARAVWAELLSDNVVENSFGKSIGLVYKWTDWLRSLL